MALKIKALLDKPLADIYHFKDDWLTVKNWKVICLPSFDQMENDNCFKSIEKAIIEFEVSDCYAIIREKNFDLGFDKATESNYSDNFCYEFKIIEDSIKNLNKEWFWANYAIFSKSIDFVLLSTQFNFALIAGEIPFIERATGMSLDEARRSFVKYSGEVGYWKYDERNLFEELLRIYF
jgi:hypothetical protein